MWELFFTFLSEIFKEVAVGTEAIFARDGVFENGSFEWGEGESHITAEENEEADAREIGEEVPHRS